ncbi:L,D-transpeptidase family protein [Candidatus Kaiserbacteria bacterium]|nr:L,D-transpeptidase family protein [Candidatus Kaiserbacteria bacterium]
MRRNDPHPFIHRLHASGVPDTEAYQVLLLEGWDRETIDPIFASRGMKIPSPPVPPQHADPKRSPRKKPSPITVMGGLFLLSFFASFTFLYMRPPVVYSISIPEAGMASTSPALSYGALPALSDPHYYTSVKLRLIDEKISFISADLSAMEMSVYTDGQLALTVPILAKGKIGSWWETPVGIYRVEWREEDHFSSIGHVHQPWSLAFQGNFFIHGWPYYDDGTPVATSYSGGCIRLSTEDAEKVYKLAQVGMPVVVFNTSYQEDSFSYPEKKPARISAKGYLLADLNNGTVLASSHASTTAPIASITKLITALVATEYIDLDKKLTVPRDAIVYTTVPRLHPGEHIRAYDLLFLLLQESSNEAAETLAAERGRNAFIAAMDRKAQSIGLTQSTFSDPSGAKEDMSTPEDLYKLLRYIYANRSFILDITKGDLADSAYGTPTFTGLSNFNIIKKAPETFVGGKVGQTNEAGETYAGIFSIPVDGHERQIVVIVLGSQDVQRDVAKLVQFVKDAYSAN